MNEPVTCWECGDVLDSNFFGTEPCTMYIDGGENITVCLACFEELGGYDQL